MVHPADQPYCTTIYHTLLSYRSINVIYKTIRGFIFNFHDFFLPISTKYCQIKMSHSIHVLNIQIDTKTLEFVIQQHKIEFLCKPYETEFSIKVSLIGNVRLLETLEFHLACAHIDLTPLWH